MTLQHVNLGEEILAEDYNDLVDAINDFEGIATEFQRFTSSGTWTKPDDVSWVYVEVIGGGAGGRANVQGGQGIGGFPGRVVRKLYRASELATSVSITIGGGGAANNNGGDTTFGSLVALGGRQNHAAVGEYTGARAALLSVGLGSGGGTLNAYISLGLPGMGLSTFTAEGSNGTDNPSGTGSGGGGNRNGNGGNGGAPGGGGGAAKSSGSAGSGARGEVRVWSW